MRRRVSERNLGNIFRRMKAYAMAYRSWAWAGRTAWIFGAVIVALFSGTACETQLSATQGTASPVIVHEYALVEESIDNPNHADFAQRAPQAVLNQREGWKMARPIDAITSLNAALAPFDFSVQANPDPPFRAYALYQNQTLIARDLANFGNLSIQPYGKDFALPVQTLDGHKLIATQNGLRAIIETLSDEQSIASTGPIYQEGLQSGGEFSGRGDAMPLGLPDGQKPENVVYAQGFGSGAFFLYSANGQAHIRFNTTDMPFVYDRIANDAAAPAFCPGGTQHSIWFYALRDGVWYYVEIDLPAT